MSGGNIQAVLTPPGAGGIAVLAVTGPDVAVVLRRVFRFAVRTSNFRSGAIHYGHVVDDAGAQPVVIDEVIVTYSDAVSGPTGQDYFEINCHGGTVPVRSIVRLLARCGVQEVSWQELTARQVRPRYDRLEAQAFELACLAPTRRAARHFFAQVEGALSGELREIVSALGSPASGTAELRRRVDDLLATAAFGIGLAHPRTVTVVGLPNVGKSTLANRLAGADRSIVHPEPGTTRDAVVSLTSISGVPVSVVDTAGLRPALDEVEAAGVVVSRRKLASADLVVWVFDHSRPLDGLESSHLELLRGKRVIPVVNKMDLAGQLPEAPLTEVLAGQPVHVSALTGRGIDELRERILQELFGPVRPEPGSPVVFSEPLRDDLTALAARLRQEPTEPGALDELAGRLSHYLAPANPD